MQVVVQENADDEAPTDDEEYAEWLQARAEADSPTLLNGRVYALGDCAANETRPLPPTAQSPRA